MIGIALILAGGVIFLSLIASHLAKIAEALDRIADK